MKLHILKLLQDATSLSRLGRFQESLALYSEILAAQPDHLEALNNFGAALGMLRRDHEALAVLERAIAISGDYHEALNNRGASFARLRMFGKALDSFERALAIQANYPDALKNRGAVLVELGRFDEALQSYERALALEPRDVSALTASAKLLRDLGHRDKAMACYDRALAIDPRSLIALNDRGTVLIGLERFREALENFEQALSIKPDYIEAMGNAGYALEKLGRHEDALAMYERALAIRPDEVGVLDNRAIALAKLGRFEESLESEDAAQMVRPNFAKSHVNEGLTRLRMGDLERGFRKYEWRWVDLEPGQQQRRFAQPLWMGRGDLKGKTILLHLEQGLGDTIQFVRYVPLVAALGARVVLEVPAILAPLMGRLAGVSDMVIQGQPLPITDFHCPLLSLPLAFRTKLETIPASIPYLSVDSKAAAMWRGKLAKSGKKLVGLCWKGNAGYKGDYERSIRFADFAPLLTVPGIQFVSLQKELSDEERRLASALPLVHPGEDFRSTAEMIAAFDLVISVDTAWAHCAGAMGKSVWVLLPFSPHWVWFMGRADSPWYPTARLFRQSKIGDWKGVIRNVKKELAKLASTV
jgi:tetratricopeptide (TPR) repeat protein